jgi:hypothetical protein
LATGLGWPVSLIGHGAGTAGPAAANSAVLGPVVLGLLGGVPVVAVVGDTAPRATEPESVGGGPLPADVDGTTPVVDAAAGAASVGRGGLERRTSNARPTMIKATAASATAPAGMRALDGASTVRGTPAPCRSRSIAI